MEELGAAPDSYPPFEFTEPTAEIVGNFWTIFQSKNSSVVWTCVSLTGVWELLGAYHHARCEYQWSYRFKTTQVPEKFREKCNEYPHTGFISTVQVLFDKATKWWWTHLVHFTQCLVQLPDVDEVQLSLRARHGLDMSDTSEVFWGMIGIRKHLPREVHFLVSITLYPRFATEDSWVYYDGPSRLCRDTRASPVIPIEIAEEIIDFVCLLPRHYRVGLKDNTRTLFSCALTCRAWLPRSRRHLYRILEGYSSAIPRAIARSHFSHIGLGYVEEIIGNNHILFNQSITHYISNKSPNLTRLTLRGDIEGSPPETRIFYPSFLMHLSQFRNVKSLKLYNYKFESLTFLRRLLGALSALEEAYLDNVTWIPERKPLTALLRATTWGLHTFKIAGCSSYDLISTWIVPSPRATSVCLKGALIEASHPGLTLPDATTIVELSERLVGQDEFFALSLNKDYLDQPLEFIWSFISQHSGVWDLKLTISIRPGTYSTNFVRFCWSRSSQHSKVPPAINQRFYYHPQTGFVFSIRLPIGAWIIDYPETLSELPTILMGFKDLRQVTIVLLTKGRLQKAWDPSSNSPLGELQGVFRGRMRNIYECCRAIANFWSLRVFVDDKEVSVQDILDTAGFFKLL